MVTPLNVMVDLASDDPTRGDSKGYIGVGRAIAQKTGGKCTVVDYDGLCGFRPHLKKVKSLRRAFYKAHGLPDILLSRDNEHSLLSYENYPLRWLGMRKFCLRVTAMNEFFSSRLYMDFDFVAHDITPDILAAEKKTFYHHYPDLKGRNIIGVLFADSVMSEAEIDLLIKNAALDAPSSIFLCGSRRTAKDDLIKMRELIKARIQMLDDPESVTLESYDLNAARGAPGFDAYMTPIYNNAAGFNPYRGLLAVSKHVIQCGPSDSIFSEILASGKSAHIVNGSLPQLRHVKNGLVRAVDTAQSDFRFETKSVNVTNPTDIVAAALIEQYEKEKEHHRILGAPFLPARGVKQFY